MNGENMNLTLKIGTISLIGLMAFGCQQPTVNTNTNVNTSLDNTTNMNSMNMNANSANMNSGSSMSEVKEPEKYQAKINLSLQAENSAGQNSVLPSLGALVARDGGNRRMEFMIPPNNEKVIYLEANGKNLVILPGRKQYAELNEQSTGFNVRSLMMPDQIVKQLQNMRGVKLAGEETVDGRTVVKYTFQSNTDTKSQAGNVATESYFLIDKETGLPVRSETVSESQNGNVQGFKGFKVVTQMSDIKTDPSADLFAEPTGFEKVDEAQIRGQVNLVFSVLTNVLTQALQTAQTTQTAPAANSNTNTNSSGNK